MKEDKVILSTDIEQDVDVFSIDRFLKGDTCQPSRETQRNSLCHSQWYRSFEKLVRVQHFRYRNSIEVCVQQGFHLKKGENWFDDCRMQSLTKRHTRFAGCGKPYRLCSTTSMHVFGFMHIFPSDGRRLN